jgi:hypothetical protein
MNSKMANLYANHKEIRKKVYKVLTSRPAGMRLDEFKSSIGLEGISSKEDMDHVEEMLQCLKKHNYIKYEEGRNYLQAETNFMIKYGNNCKKSFKKPQNSPYNINSNNNHSNYNLNKSNNT